MLIHKDKKTDVADITQDQHQLKTVSIKKTDHDFRIHVLF